MSYYTGMGDYYSGKGDPGLFGFIRKGIGAVAGAIGGLVPGPVGAIAKGVSRIVTPRTPRPAAGVRSPLVGAPSTMPVIQMPPSLQPTPGFVGAAQRALPGGATGFQTTPGGNPCWPGYHLNKSRSYATGAEPGSVCVKNRRMNPLNPKALRRAIRRQAGAITLMKRALKGSGYTFKRTGAPTRRRRRKR